MYGTSTALSFEDYTCTLRTERDAGLMIDLSDRVDAQTELPMNEASA